MPPCKLCHDKETAAPTGVCRGCCAKLGIVEMPPSRRPPHPCARCNATTFIRAVPREYTVVKAMDSNWPEVAPMTLTQAPEVSEKLLFTGNNVDVNPITKGLGVLETYTCKKCGFVEWYCQDPETVPIGPEYMTELVEYETTTPYR